VDRVPGHVPGALLAAQPFQKPHPPIWFGASHPDALRRAVRLGDGFFGAGSQTTAAFADQVRIVREEVARQGRDGFRIAKRVYIAVDDDGERARRRIAAALDELYGLFGLRGVEAVAVAGTVDDCVRGLREVVAAGAEQILLNPLFDDAVQMERLAADVVAQLAEEETRCGTRC
jgi:alkanesulfonate monooxygenase SsuD/methylene tetrahydromethanopterin reductase-like flavin-dependent oxidoreductase (luciferase family)